MDSAMRDLGRIQERNEDSEGRPVIMVGLLLGVTVALVLGLGALVSAGGDGEDVAREEDPLARLERARFAAAPPTEEPEERVDVDRAALTFPRSLSSEDERPEVAAALAAAVAELEHPSPLPAEVARPPAPRPEAAVILPASLAATSAGDNLTRAAEHDPLMAAALPREPEDAPARAGSDGAYTVQVISYDSREGADAFAAGLRARGHRAFVVSAEIEGRGTMWRVRIGPFENLRQAQAYRRDFERTERMNTLVVRRRDSV